MRSRSLRSLDQDAANLAMGRRSWSIALAIRQRASGLPTRPAPLIVVLDI